MSWKLKTRHAAFATFAAADALALSLNGGEVFGLRGSNGAGKTTTIKMLTTLLSPSSGEERVAGFSITTQAVSVRRAIGYWMAWPWKMNQVALTICDGIARTAHVHSFNPE